MDERAGRTGSWTARPSRPPAGPAAAPTGAPPPPLWCHL